LHLLPGPAGRFDFLYTAGGVTSGDGSTVAAAGSIG
jgi:hypothetical protein